MDTNRTKILVVDDDNDVVEAIKDTLQVTDPTFDVYVANTSEEALKIVHDEIPDIIITDIYLPDINGIDICRYIKNDPEFNIIPILMITGVDTDAKGRVKILEAGAEALLFKPFEKSELLAHVAALLRLKRAEDQVRLERDRLKNEVILKDKHINDHQERLGLILNHIIEGIWDWDIRNDTIFISNMSKELLGYNNDELMNNRMEAFMELIYSEDRERFRIEINDYLNHINPLYKSEVRMYLKGGNVGWFLFRGYAIWDKDDKPIRLLGIQSDITETKENYQNLEKIALYDYVTKLPNRVLFYKLSEKIILAGKRDKNKVAFLFIDLDNFKVVNDSYGHDYGDKLLAVLAKRMSENIRPGDQLARFAGDEFIVALPKISDRSQITTVVNRLRRSLETPFNIEQHQVVVEFSVGYSLYPDDGDKLDDLLKTADLRMYQEKEERKRRPKAKFAL